MAQCTLRSLTSTYLIVRLFVLFVGNETDFAKSLFGQLGEFWIWMLFPFIVEQTMICILEKLGTMCLLKCIGSRSYIA